MNKKSILRKTGIGLVVFGIGVYFGQSTSDGDNTTPLWIAVICIIFGAMLFGMGLSTNDASPVKQARTKSGSDTDTK